MWWWIKKSEPQVRRENGSTFISVADTIQGAAQQLTRKTHRITGTAGISTIPLKCESFSLPPLLSMLKFCVHAKHIVMALHERNVKMNPRVYVFRLHKNFKHVAPFFDMFRASRGARSSSWAHESGKKNDNHDTWTFNFKDISIVFIILSVDYDAFSALLQFTWANVAVKMWNCSTSKVLEFAKRIARREWNVKLKQLRDQIDYILTWWNGNVCELQRIQSKYFHLFLCRHKFQIITIEFRQFQIFPNDFFHSKIHFYHSDLFEREGKYNSNKFEILSQYFRCSFSFSFSSTTKKQKKIDRSFSEAYDDDSVLRWCQHDTQNWCD